MCDYLDIDLNYSEKGKFKVSMIKYLHKILTRFSEYWKLGNSVATPAQDHLFQVREEKETQLLSEEMSQEFHNMVA